MVDKDGFRLNVGIIVCNQEGNVLWARRYQQNSWQFPQGGVNEGETEDEAMYRELNEEVGLLPEHVEIVARSKNWLRYRLPKRMIRWDNHPICIGQKQRWFLLKLTVADSKINLMGSNTPEFDDWQWVSYWYPIRQVINFKQEVYRRALKEFSQPLQKMRIH